MATFNGVPNVVESPYPTCSCEAGKCIVLTEKDGKDAGRKYFACPVKKGQGACNFKLWHDLLGKGGEEAVVRELKFFDTVSLSHHGEQRASLSSGPSNRESLDMVADGGHVGEQPESVGQGARSYLQHLDGPGKDFQRDGVTRAIFFSDTGAQSQYGEQRKSFSPRPFEGEIIDGEASGDHIAVQSDSEGLATAQFNRSEAFVWMSSSASSQLRKLEWAPKCPCGYGYMILKTSRTAHNPGRRFYKCPDLHGERGCGLLIWKDDVEADYTQNGNFGHVQNESRMAEMRMSLEELKQEIKHEIQLLRESVETLHCQQEHPHYRNYIIMIFLLFVVYAWGSAMC